jgi:hypothetical protein
MTLTKIFILLFPGIALGAYQPVTITEVSGTARVEIVSGSVTVNTTGLATSANQVSQTSVLNSLDSSLAAINSKVPSMGQALAASSTPVVLTALQLADLKNTSATVVSSALPTGAATSAKQDSQTTLLGTIEGYLSDILLSIGSSGSSNTTYVQSVAGSDGSNNRVLKTDSNGELQIDVLSLPAVSTTGTIPVSLASVPTHSVTVLNSLGVASGSITANAGTGTFVVSSTGVASVSGSLTINGIPSVSTTGTIPVSLASVPSHSVTVLNSLGIASGSITANAGTGTFNVSGTVAANPSGTYTVQYASTPSVSTTGTIPVSFPSIPSVSNVGTVIVSSTGTVPTSLASVPTHAVTQSGGPWTVSSTGTVPVDIQDASISVNVLNSLGIASGTLTGITNTVNVSSTGTVPVSGTVSQNGLWSVSTTGTVIVSSTGTVPTSLASVPTHAVTQSGNWSQSILNSLGIASGTLTSITNTVVVSSTGTVPVSFPATPTVSTTGTIPVSFPSGVSTTGVISTWETPQSGSTNALTNSDNANVSKVSVKGSAGRLYLMTCYNGNSSAGWIHIFNSAAQPAQNTAPTLPPISVGAGQNCTYDAGLFGNYLSSGIYIGFSTSATAWVNTTGSSSTWISVKYQ